VQQWPGKDDMPSHYGRLCSALCVQNATTTETNCNVQLHCWGAQPLCSTPQHRNNMNLGGLSASQLPTEQFWCWPHSKLSQTIGWRWIWQGMEMAGSHLHDILQQGQLTAVTVQPSVLECIAAHPTQAVTSHWQRRLLCSTTSQLFPPCMIASLQHLGDNRLDRALSPSGKQPHARADRRLVNTCWAAWQAVVEHIRLEWCATKFHSQYIPLWLGPSAQAHWCTQGRSFAVPEHM
jgi:hypothetical protein